MKKSKLHVKITKAIKSSYLIGLTLVIIAFGISFFEETTAKYIVCAGFMLLCVSMSRMTRLKRMEKLLAERRNRI